ncbi:MAG: DMT family transporter [Nocardioidaceae bacterium]
MGIIWGSNFIWMKWASAHITPEQIALARVLFGLVPVLAFGLIRRDFRRWHLRYVHHYLAMALLATSLYYVLYAAGTARLASGIAGALSGAIPLFAFVAGAIALPDERATPQRVLGVLLGAAGVAVIARPWSADGSIDLVGVGLMLLGAACIGVSFVYTRRFITDLGIPATALTTYQMGLGLIVLLLFTDVHGVGAITSDPKALGGLIVGLGLVGTGVSYVVYYFLIAEFGATTAAASAYVPPVVALLIGWLAVGEHLNLTDGVAIALILMGIAFIRPSGRPPETGAIESA